MTTVSSGLRRGMNIFAINGFAALLFMLTAGCTGAANQQVLFPECKGLNDCRLNCPGDSTLTKDALNREVYCEQDRDKHGPWISWHENGRVRWRLEYKEGKLHGTNVVWYDNGRKMSESEYVNGKTHGRATGWYPDGQKEFEGEFKEGLPHGRFSGWHKNGHAEARGTFVKGVLNGEALFWHDNGQKSGEFLFEKGTAIEEACWDKTGKSVECTSALLKRFRQ